MQDTSKYLIHARITADGVVERSDVVGAVFGQTEGLLGDELDLRDLQQSSKVGRIDVEIDSEHGQSFGELTITSSLDKVETAILAASLESITRVGPCEARVEVAEIEDMRAAKRREVVERAKQLLAESFDDSVMDSAEILAEVRDAQRVERIDDYAGYPAGPRVADSDAVIVVEGRADVTTLLEYGIKNAVAVEGTNVPGEVADLTQERTVTAFLDGDRGGDLILRELAQVGDVDYVAYAPDGASVEDLSREAVMDALRDKVPFDTVSADGRDGARVSTDGATAEPPTNATDGAADATTGRRADESDDGAGRTTGSVRASGAGDREAVGGVGETNGDSVTVDAEAVADEIAGGGTDAEAGADDTTTDDAEPAGGTDDAETDGTDDDAATDETTNDSPAETGEETPDEAPADDTTDDAATDNDTTDDADDDAATDNDTTDDADDDAATDDDTTDDADDDAATDDAPPATLRGHVEAVIDAGTNTARLLDREMEIVVDVPVGAAFDTLADEETTGFTLVVDGQVDQRLLDVAAQRGVEQIVARSSGEFVKRPASVRVVTADRLASA